MWTSAPEPGNRSKVEDLFASHPNPLARTSSRKSIRCYLVMMPETHLTTSPRLIRVRRWWSDLDQVIPCSAVLTYMSVSADSVPTKVEPEAQLSLS